MSKIARDLSVTPSAVRYVIDGYSKSRRIAREVSRVTGLAINEMWPGVYEEK